MKLGYRYFVEYFSHLGRWTGRRSFITLRGARKYIFKSMSRREFHDGITMRIIRTYRDTQDKGVEYYSSNGPDPEKTLP